MPRRCVDTFAHERKYIDARLRGIEFWKPLLSRRPSKNLFQIRTFAALAVDHYVKGVLLMLDSLENGSAPYFCWCGLCRVLNEISPQKEAA